MRAISRFFRRHPRLSLASVLTAPVAWLLVVYIGSLVLLVVSAFFKLDEQSQKPTTELTTDNLRIAFTHVPSSSRSC